MVHKLKRNINIVYGLAFFHMFMLIVPVIVPFFQSKGLSLAEIFQLQAIYAAVIVVLEAPSGYFADVMGRRAALLVGGVAHGLGYLSLNFATDFAGLLIFEVTLGVAMSMLSGADLALLYDSEQALAKEDTGYTQSLARLGFTKSVAEGLGALLGGLIALWSFELMVLLQSLLAWGCLVLALLVYEPPDADGLPVRRRAIPLGEVYRHLADGDRVLKLVFIALPVYNLTTMHVVWLIQPYWDNLGLSLALFGVLWFVQNLTIAVANQCGYVLEKARGAAFALTLIGALPVIGLFGMAAIGGWIGMALGFTLFFCRGLYQVILLNALNRRIPGHCRATMNSLNSSLFRLGFIATGPLMGGVADHYGLETALYVLGAGSVAMFLVVMLPLIRAVRLLPR